MLTRISFSPRQPHRSRSSIAASKVVVAEERALAAGLRILVLLLAHAVSSSTLSFEDRARAGGLELHPAGLPPNRFSSRRPLIARHPAPARPLRGLGGFGRMLETHGGIRQVSNRFFDLSRPFGTRSLRVSFTAFRRPLRVLLPLFAHRASLRASPRIRTLPSEVPFQRTLSVHTADCA
jgi:hypothetical protein